MIITTTLDRMKISLNFKLGTNLGQVVTPTHKFVMFPIEMADDNWRWWFKLKEDKVGEKNPANILDVQWDGENFHWYISRSEDIIKKQGTI